MRGLATGELSKCVERGTISTFEKDSSILKIKKNLFIKS